MSGWAGAAAGADAAEEDGAGVGRLAADAAAADGGNRFMTKACVGHAMHGFKYCTRAFFSTASS